MFLKYRQVHKAQLKISCKEVIRNTAEKALRWQSYDTATSWTNTYCIKEFLQKDAIYIALVA